MSSSEPPDDEPAPLCPICGRTLDAMVVAVTGELIGCEECARGRGLTGPVISLAEWRAADAVQSALSQYGVVTYTASKQTQFPGGVPRANLWDIRANGRRYLLKRLHPWLSAEAALYEHSVLRCLGERRVPVAQPVADAMGATVVEADGARWALYPTLDGVQASKQEWMWRVPKAAETLATLHLALQDCSPDGSPHPAWVAWTLEMVDSTIGHWPAVPDLSPDLLASARTRLAERYFGDLYPELPRTIIHGNFGIANVLWQGDVVSGVLDLERAHPDTPLFDIGWGVGMRWPPLMRAIVATYTRVRPLSPAEREALPEALLLGTLYGINEQMITVRDPAELSRRAQDLYFLMRDSETLRKAVAAR
jgi:homoserine kinase type II